MSENVTSRDLDRADHLFQKLAAEEPPLNPTSDTAPSRTAPRRAVKNRSNRMRWMIMGILATFFLATVLITIFVFADSSEADTPVSDNAEAALPQENPAIIPDQANTEAIEPPVSTPQPVPTRPLVTPALPPTAAADEIAVALQSQVNTASQPMNVALANNPFTITGSSGRAGVTTYVVKTGDTLSGIANAFGLDICTLVWSNTRSKISPLRPNAVLDILPVDGVFYKVDRNLTIQELADQTGVDPYEIINFAYNDLQDDAPETMLIDGMRVVVPGGSGGDCNLWAPPNIVASTDSTGAGVSGTGSTGSRSGGTLWGCDYEVANPGYPGMRPLQGSYKFWQGFSSVHSGVDLSASTGTPVYASGAGTVAFAAWNDWGYGNAVVIDHGTGMYTLYAHLSSISVTCGQSLNQGDMIGGVGSTGRSSGPHLHFEIRNGSFDPLDPLSYISM